MSSHRANPFPLGEITACGYVAQLCSSSKAPLAPQKLLLQAGDCYITPLTAVCWTKSHFWAQISLTSACFPADSQLMFIIQRNTAQTPCGLPGDAVTPRLWLKEQTNGSLKQEHHPLRAAENRDSWPCLQTNALSFLGQEPGILRASGQVTTWYWYQLRNIRWNFNYHWKKFNLKNPHCFSRSWRQHNQVIYLSSKK